MCLMLWPPGRVMADSDVTSCRAVVLTLVMVLLKVCRPVKDGPPTLSIPWMHRSVVLRSLLGQVGGLKPNSGWTPWYTCLFQVGVCVVLLVVVIFVVEVVVVVEV